MNTIQIIIIFIGIETIIVTIGAFIWEYLKFKNPTNLKVKMQLDSKKISKKIIDDLPPPSIDAQLDKLGI